MHGLHGQGSRGGLAWTPKQKRKETDTPSGLSYSSCEILPPTPSPAALLMEDQGDNGERNIIFLSPPCFPWSSPSDGSEGFP